MVFSSFSPKTFFKVTSLTLVGIFISSCGSYQSTSYYGEDGIYGSSDTPRVEVGSNNSISVPQKKQNTQKDSYYKDYFAEKAAEYDYINDENVDVFTDANTYSSLELGANNSHENISSNASYGAWGDNPTKINIHLYSNPRPYYLYWGYAYPWYFNDYYYDSFYDPFYYRNYHRYYGYRGWRPYYSPYDRYYYRNHWGYHHGHQSYHNRYYQYRSNVSYVSGHRGTKPSRRGKGSVSVVGKTRNSSVSHQTNSAVSSRAVSTDRRASYRKVENRSVNYSRRSDSGNNLNAVHKSQVNNNVNKTSKSDTKRNSRVPSSRRSDSKNSSNNSYTSSSRSSSSYSRSSSNSGRSYSTPRSSNSSRSVGSSRGSGSRSNRSSRR